MKTIMHPDYWVEIPAGEYLTGISETQADLIRAYLYAKIEYNQLPVQQRQVAEALIAMYHHEEQMFRSGQIEQLTARPLDLSPAEQTLYETEPYATLLEVELQLSGELGRRRAVWLDRFYLARFPFIYTNPEVEGLLATQIPGQLEETSREVPSVRPEAVLWLCQELGVRLPTNLEWDKAARGPDSYLYPWGDVWNPEASQFYYGQPNTEGRRVDAYPDGVSPYGVWFMAGGLPELIISLGFGERPRIYLRGCHARESSAETAWWDHMLINNKGGHWVSLRPAMSRWPRQQWSGFWTPPNPKAKKARIWELPSALPTARLAVIDADNAARLKPLALLRPGEPLAADTPHGVEDIIWPAPDEITFIIDSPPRELWTYTSGQAQSPTIIERPRGGYNAISHDKQRFALVQMIRHKIRVWDMRTRREIFSAQTIGQPARAAFSEDGQLLAVSDINWRIYVWDLTQGTLKTTIKGPDKYAQTLCFTPTGERLISSSKDGRLWVWQVEGGRLVQTLLGHTGLLYQCQFTADHRLLVSAGSDGTVRFWDMTTGQAAQVLREPNGNVIADFSFSPDGKLLATGQCNGTFTLWDWERNDIAAIIPCNGPWIDGVWVVHVSFSPDGAMLATYNRGAMMWGLPDEA